MPSPATPTEETRQVLSERMIVQQWSEGAINVSGALSDAYNELSTDGQREVMRFARAVERAVLAALPRGKVSEEEKLAALNNMHGVSFRRYEEWRGFTVRKALEAGIALGLSRGGGDGERDAARNALTGLAARWNPDSSFHQDTLFYRDMNYPLPAPAPVVRSVRLSDGSVVRTHRLSDLNRDSLYRSCDGRITHSGVPPGDWRVFLNDNKYTGADFDALKAFAAALPVEASDAAR